MATMNEVATSATELRSVLGLLLRRLRGEHGLPISHGAVLGRLERCGPATTSALAAAERVRPQSMAQTIADLEAEGLISRTPDADDRRQVQIGLTPAGHAKVDEERARRDGWLTQAIELELTPEEQEVLIRAVALLRRVAEN
jgi:DNA-binding MarR family transcriptional regulator